MKNYTEKIITPYGHTCHYNKKGEYHRTDGPAVIWKDGTKIWFVNGKRHREDGPAVEYKNGDKWWYLNGVIHTQVYFLRLTRHKENYNFKL